MAVAWWRSPGGGCSGGPVLDVAEAWVGGAFAGVAGQEVAWHWWILGVGVGSGTMPML